MKPGRFNQLRVVATAACLLAAAPMAGAWQVKSHYPMSVDPSMPDATQAQRIVSAPPLVLRAVRDAHRQSLQRGWKGVPAAVDQAKGITSAEGAR